MPAAPGRVFVVAGSRDYPDRNQVGQELDLVLQAGDVVITGGARGVDSWADVMARHRGCRSVVMPADWVTHGKRAGMLRNRAMLERLVKARALGWETMVICFWDGKSAGTNHTRRIADELLLNLVTFSPAA